ncbi:Transcription factor, fungi [Penicillium expansum]|uniref:Transcription factor, fungi n=1 Tax=Penicillium expansum TaxID=27334 RepID=A0A0A2JBA5_PENEN|nr:Transcription factor, fungi [Penicillium expansum]KGO43656.1 Transcription factor, fungi [Penicillium expansum]KGO44870.1 Transcription factor, fungi [Penicillium expansum]KGO52682.1 Transcription factor, fungi [Penicillium expansum]
MGPSSPIGQSTLAPGSKQRGQASSVSCIPRKFAIEPISNAGGNLSHAAIPSYVSTLKRKRDDLSDQLERQRASRSGEAPAEPPQTPRSASRHRQEFQYATGPSRQDCIENTVQAAMGEIGFLSTSAMAEPRDETSGFSEELAMGRMVRAALALSGATPSQSNIDSYGQQIAAINGPTVHLSRQLAVPFFTTFLDMMGSQMIHIDSNELWTDFDTFFTESNDLVEKYSSNCTAKIFVVYMSVATGVLLSRESGSLQGLAGALHQKATKLLPGIMRSGNKIEILQCMLSLILYSMQNPQGGSTWHLVGLAMKKAIAFRFHHGSDSSVNIPSHTLLMRRNIFWSLYTVDRTISTIMDRPFNIEDDEITVKEPDQYMSDLPHMKNKLARQSVAHARLMSEIRDGAVNSVLYHYSNLCYWRDSARNIKSEPSASEFPRAVVIELASRAMVEVLKTNGSADIEPSMIHSSQNIERDIVTTCSEFIEHAYQSSDRGEFTGSFVEAYDIFAAGVVIVCLNVKSPSSFTDAGVMNKCTALLTTVGERFAGLRVFRRVLWALFNTVSGNSKSDPIVHELPPIIPDGIRNLIAGILR